MDSVKLHYEVSGDDFTRAGEASGDVKRVLKELGFDPDVVRNVSIAMYEGEINMDVELAMKAGYSTAPDQVRSLGFGAGMGLPNIKKYTDEMVIETEIDVGTTMRLKVYTQNQPSA